jgi:diaminohydroxyphosphoribosylaminopyrimidine deaminase / 5-amino-6-(5-phosphoribosylamino)uracil reductase
LTKRRQRSYFLDRDVLYQEIFSPLRHIRTDGPYVIAQVGQSLDGRIATENGDAGDIGGLAGLDHLHHLRARADVVVAGAGTAMADDPRLTVRRVPGKTPARAVIDPAGRTPAGLRWLADDGAKRILITNDGSLAGCDEIIRLPLGKNGIEPAAIVANLFALGLHIILIEGGPTTIRQFMQAGCIDRLHVCVSPLIIGSGKSGLTLDAISSLKDAVRPATRIFMLGGGEVLYDCDLRKRS